ncbi:D-alanyl-D-alanine carboxypeptidase family protein [Fredinandcohnia humi]
MKKVLGLLLIVAFIFSIGLSFSDKIIAVIKDQGDVQSAEATNREISSDKVTKEMNESSELKEDRPVIDPQNEFLILVSKEVGQLAPNYIPDNMVVPNVSFSTGNPERKFMVKEAAMALEKMFAEAYGSGIILHAQSGYRSYKTQQGIYQSYVNEYGVEEADTFSAKAGQSEHQTGLAMDVTSESVNLQLVQEFGETTEGKWLVQNASRFGFIVRYPKGKESITGYMYEPWHLRYVGVEHAEYMTEHDLTLEEYLGMEEK